MKIIQTIISKDAPNVSDGLWAQPVSGGFVLYLLAGGKWVPLKSIDDADTAKLNDDASYKAVREIKTGSSNGQITVDGKGVEVKGLDSAAYSKTSDFDAAGAAAAVLGTADDTKEQMTLYGLKAYIDDALGG